MSSLSLSEVLKHDKYLSRCYIYEPLPEDYYANPLKYCKEAYPGDIYDANGVSYESLGYTIIKIIGQSPTTVCRTYINPSPSVKFYPRGDIYELGPVDGFNKGALKAYFGKVLLDEVESGADLAALNNSMLCDGSVLYLHLPKPPWDYPSFVVFDGADGDGENYEKRIILK